MSKHLEESVIGRFLARAEERPGSEALAYYSDGGFHVSTYGDLKDAVLSLAGFMAEQGVHAGDHCAIMLGNGLDWVALDLACAYLGAVSVPIHTSYNGHYVAHILTHGDIKYFFAGAEFIDIIRPVFQSGGPSPVLVVCGRLPHDFPKGAKTLEVRSFFSIDHEASVSRHMSGGDSIHTIVYTSGTTGVPKGVVLTNGNILSNVDGAKEYIVVDETDRFLSFLPLSHILERTAGYYVPILSGAAVYFARSSQTLSEDMKLARPTILISVPRVFEKAHEKIMAKFSKPLLHRIFKQAIQAAKEKNFMARVYETLLFKKIKASFGGRLRFAVSGGAALPKHIAELFEAIGIVIVEGYGLTETSPILTMNTLKNYKFGTVGIPLRGVQIRIDNQGEILAKGPGIMREYYKSVEMTDQAIDADGWFHTGDIGSTDTDRFLTIIGRLKEMIVLSTGRNVFPVPIEQQLEESPYIDQAMIYGDRQAAISGLIVPSFRKLEEWCRENSVEYRLPDVLTEKKVIEFFSGEIQKMLSRMQHFEQARNFKLIPHAFTLENDMLTPTLKLKRKNILGKYVS